MKRIYFFVAVAMTMLASCSNISNATVADIEKACKKEDWKTAKLMCEGYVKKDRTNPVVFKCLGDAYLGLKDSTFAQYSYDQAIALDSTYVDAIVSSADVTMNGGLPQMAISQLMNKMKYIPDNAQLHNALGCAFRLAGNNNEAQANFEKAVLLDQNYVPARRNLAIVQIDSRELDDAILNLERTLDENSKQADVYNYLAIAYVFKDDAEEAEKYFLKSISIDRTYLPAIENLAYHYEHNGKLDKSKKYYKMAAKLGSVNAKNMLKNNKFNKDNKNKTK